MFSVAIVALSACAGPPAKQPNPMRPIDERRATSIIAAGYRDSGENPSEGRDITLPTGKSLHVDVGTVGRKYGVAYLTAADPRAARRQARSPAPSAQRRFAHRPRGGADSGAVILVLFADDYQYDDLAGESARVDQHHGRKSPHPRRSRLLGPGPFEKLP